LKHAVTPPFYTLSLHDALPISSRVQARPLCVRRPRSRLPTGHRDRQPHMWSSCSGLCDLRDQWDESVENKSRRNPFSLHPPPGVNNHEMSIRDHSRLQPSAGKIHTTLRLTLPGDLQQRREKDRTVSQWTDRDKW